MSTRAEDLRPLAQSGRTIPVGAAVADLVVSVGTGDGTIADVGGSFSQATLNNNFRDLADKVNVMLARMRAAGLISP